MNSTHEIKSRADMRNRQAVALQSQCKYRESLAAFQEALEFYRKLRDIPGQGRCLNGVGAVYKDLAQYDEALRFLEEALKYRKQAGDLRGLTITMETLGPVYAVFGRCVEAEKLLERALDIARELEDPKTVGEGLFNLGQIALIRMNYGEAL